MLDLVLKGFEEVVVEVNQMEAKRVARLESVWAESNSGIPPIMDSLGRLHAPVDGYSLPLGCDYIDPLAHDRIYQKGQFLPLPLTGWDEIDYAKFQKSKSLAERFMPRDKIKIEYDLGLSILEALEGNSYITFSLGKSWEVNDKQVCYLYLTSYSQSVLNKFVASVKSSIENNDKQVYTGEAYEGRCTVKGKIKFIKQEDFRYGYTVTTSFKAFIELENGSACSGNLASSIGYDAKVGDVIEFTATFTKSEKTEGISYYKRPSKMKILETQ